MVLVDFSKDLMIFIIVPIILIHGLSLIFLGVLID